MSPRSNADVLGHADTCASCTAEACIGDLSAGDLVITEVMPNPDACGDRDNAGEYIEVYNATGMTVDLNCLELTDGGDHYGFVEESTVVGAGAYAVLQRRGDEYCYDAALAAAGAPTAVYRKKVSLNNTEDSITLSYGDVAFDSVSYTSDWPFSAGVSIEFSTDLLGESPTVANDSVESWCGSDGMIEGTADMGSPGVANGDCTSLMGSSSRHPAKKRPAPQNRGPASLVLLRSLRLLADHSVYRMHGAHHPPSDERSRNTPSVAAQGSACPQRHRRPPQSRSDHRHR